MNIDWSKAPEGATHYAEVASGRACWYMVKSESEYAYAYQYEDFSCGRWTNGGRVPRHQPLIERPKKQEVWNGEGLPPVGAKCEVDHGGRVFWDIVTIIAHHGKKAIYEDPHGHHQYLWGLAGDFRPIKTAEQLAEEEREDAANKMFQRFGGIGGLTKKQCIWVVSEGYRKQ